MSRRLLPGPATGRPARFVVTFVSGPFSAGPQIELPAGDVTVGVVRIGDTVRRPHQRSSPLVADYLRHLDSVGFHGAPRFLGVDALGRDVLSFLEGDVPGDPVEPWAARDEVLPSVARLLRRLHDASEGFAPEAKPVPSGRPPPTLPAGEARLVTHRDVTPQNTVFGDGEAVAVVDFDLADWSTRSLDLANTAMHWVPLCDPLDRRGSSYDGIDVAARVRMLLDAYGRDAVSPERLLDTAALRFTASYDVMHWNAQHLGGGWARMWDEGLGDVIRRRVRWFDTVRDVLAARLS